MKIHHATAKKAADAGFEFEESNGSVNVVADGVVWGKAKDPKEALQMAMDNHAADTPYESMAAVGRQIVPPKYRQRYAPNNDRCGDEISELLSAAVLTTDEKGREVLDEKAYLDVCAENDLDPMKWDHLNNGMRRMNLGNVLRGRYRKGEEVVINGRKIVGEVKEAA
jgi:hypothetical protein